MPLPLPLMHRVAGRPVLVVGDAELVAPKRRFVERAGGVVHDSLAAAVEAGARLAFVGYRDDSAARALAADARAAGMLVNVVDRPELCDFTTPAVIDRDPVLVAVATGGVSAGLAKHLRLRLEALLPATLGALADGLGQGRAVLRQRFADPADRRRAIDAALEEGAPLDPFDPAAATRVAQWLADAEMPASIEPVTINLTSDDPEDITLRHARLLGRADLVLHEAEVPRSVLARARADAERQVWTGGSVPQPPDGALVVILRAATDATCQAASASAGAASAK